MVIYSKILVWAVYSFEKMPKTGFRNVADVYLGICKKVSTKSGTKC